MVSGRATSRNGAPPSGEKLNPVQCRECGPPVSVYKDGALKPGLAALADLHMNSHSRNHSYEHTRSH